MSSTAFADGRPIPANYTCSGADTPPPLRWSGMPGGARSIALTVIDPDAPGKPFVHWILFNLPPSTSELPEGAQPPAGSVQGHNDFGGTGYRGPCPPSGPAHHYHFKVYALDTELSSRAGESEAAIQDAVRGHVLASGELVGTFKR